MCIQHGGILLQSWREQYRSFSRDVHYFRLAILVYHFQLRNDCKYNSELQFKPCFRHGCLGMWTNSGKKPDSSSFPLSDYAKKPEPLVTQRYLEKISVIGIDPALIEGKHFEEDCLPPLESTDLLSPILLLYQMCFDSSVSFLLLWCRKPRYRLDSVVDVSM